MRFRSATVGLIVAAGLVAAACEEKKPAPAPTTPTPAPTAPTGATPAPTPAPAN